MFYILYTTCSLTIFLYFHIFMFFLINRFALYLLEYAVLSVQIRRYAAVYLKKKDFMFIKTIIRDYQNSLPEPFAEFS